MKKTVYVAASALLSVVLHLLLLNAAGKLTLRPYWGGVFQEPEQSRRLRVRSVSIRDRVFRPAPPSPEAALAAAKEEATEAIRASKRVKDIFKDEKLVARARPELRLEGLGANVLTPKLPVPAPPRQPSQVTRRTPGPTRPG